jgi:hypothetical protein
MGVWREFYGLSFQKKSQIRTMKIEKDIPIILKVPFILRHPIFFNMQHLQ